MIRLRLSFGKNTTEVECPSYHGQENMLSVFYISDGINLDHLVTVVFVRFLYCEVTIFFFFSFSFLWKQVRSSLHSKGKGKIPIFEGYI